MQVYAIIIWKVYSEMQTISRALGQNWIIAFKKCISIFCIIILQLTFLKYKLWFGEQCYWMDGSHMC